MKKQTKINLILIIATILLMVGTIVGVNTYTKYLIMKEIERYEVQTTETTVFKNN